MVDQLYKFDPWCRTRALIYHRIFHFSASVQVNHMVFLHTYLFGVGLIAAAIGWPVSLITSLFYVSYATWVIRPLRGAILYSILVFAIFMLPFIWKVIFQLSWVKWMVALVGIGIVLLSFIFQLLGHYFHEDFFAPPNLMHGFIAAPILEVQWLLLSVFCKSTGEYNVIMGEVLNSRKLLIADKARCDSERPLVPGK